MEIEGFLPSCIGISPGISSSQGSIREIMFEIPRLEASENRAEAGQHECW